MSAVDNRNKKVALITGITGQDGSYLAELLIAKGYTVHGVVRRTSSLERSRLRGLYEDDAIYGKSLFLHYADLEDITTLRRIIAKVEPAEIYHLAGQSHVGLSFEIPETTCELTAMATLRLLEVLRDLPHSPRLLHASSSEVFGAPREFPQTEETLMNPVTPYGCAKAFATQMVRIYRSNFEIYCLNAISYNHESPRRGENFVSRKICKAVAEISLGLRKRLTLGNLSACRDWSDARDVVHGYYLALQNDTPQDYVFCSGVLHSVQDMVEIAFQAVNLDASAHVEIDEKFLRVTDPSRLLGDPTKAMTLLGWKPRYSFRDTILSMVASELELAKK